MAFSSRILLLLALAISMVHAQEEEEPDHDGNFADDLAPYVTFRDKLITKYDDDEEDVVWDESKSFISIDARVSMTGIDLSELDASTPFSVEVGDFQFYGILGDDPSYQPGKTSISIPLYDDYGNPQARGSVSLSWTSKVLTFSVYAAWRDSFTILAEDYLEDEDTVDDTTDATLSFHDRSLDGATVYVTGRARTWEITRDDWDYDLSNVNLTGEMDIKPPALIITKPGSTTVNIKTPITDIEGSASDNIAVHAIYLEVNGGGFVRVTGTTIMSTGATKWTVKNVPLLPGLNTIRAYAIDSEGNWSPLIERTFWYKETLRITRSGSGSLTRGFLNNSLRVLGEDYTVTASAGRGYFFGGWSGGITSFDNPLTFTMEKGLSFHATFASFAEVKAAYFGMVEHPDDGSSIGFVKAKVTGTGGVSGTIFFQNKRYAFKGEFNAKAIFKQKIRVNGGRTLTIYLQLDPANRSISGWAANGVVTSQLAINRAAFDGFVAVAEQEGQHTFHIDHDIEQPGMPQGVGHGSMTVSATGMVQLAGVLGDGRPFTQTVPLAADGTFPLFARPYRKGDSISGVVTFGDSDTAGGLLQWLKLRDKKGAYRQGFATEAQFASTRYFAPPPGERILDFLNESPNGVLQFLMGEDAVVEPRSLFLADDNTVTLFESGRSKLVFAAHTGRFKGTLFEPGRKKAQKFSGTVDQTTSRGRGVFVRGGAAGAIELAPAP